MKILEEKKNRKKERKKQKKTKQNRLGPGWLGASFGLRNCYVRIIITRNRLLIIWIIISNVIDIKQCFYTREYFLYRQVYKETIRNILLCIKESFFLICVFN